MDRIGFSAGRALSPLPALRQGKDPADEVGRIARAQRADVSGWVPAAIRQDRHDRLSRNFRPLAFQFSSFRSRQPSSKFTGQTSIRCSRPREQEIADWRSGSPSVRLACFTWRRRSKPLFPKRFFVIPKRRLADLSDIASRAASILGFSRAIRLAKIFGDKLRAVGTAPTPTTPAGPGLTHCPLIRMPRTESRTSRGATPIG